jgi:hypothetical protein
MYNTRDLARRYVLAAILGAIGGGLLVALATKAIPKMMSGMMSGMMQNMMGQMRKSGFNPAEMCEKMMKGCGEDQPEEALSE